MSTDPMFPITFDEIIPPTKPKPCERFHLGCTCGPCQEFYFRVHGNSCTLGRPPEKP